MQPWVLANPHGILIDGQRSAWHAGRVLDMLSLGAGRILVASETGGVWLIDGAFNSIPLSDDWEFPNTECLAFGPQGPNHIFAGCEGGLYETDVRAADPLRTWHSVKLPANVQTVYRIVTTTTQPPRVVIATDRSVWWAIGYTSAAYEWKEAIGLDTTAPFFGLARSDSGVIAAVRNSVAEMVPDAVITKTVSGIYVGQWNATDLVMKRSTINGFIKDQINAMLYISVATCRDHPERAFAVCANSVGAVLAVLRSATGGEIWDPCPTKLEGNHSDKWNIQSVSGTAEQGGWHKTISVHPTNPDVVGFGWKHALLSKNRGDSWRLLGGNWINPEEFIYATPHMHHDVHALYFEPEFTNRRLYILSDGGVIQTPDWDGESTDFKSAMNRNLANLQFYSPDSGRGYWGTLGTCDFAPLIGGGLQDNANVWCGLGSGFYEWKKAEPSGDGGWVAFIKHSGGQLLANTMGDSVGRFGWKANTFTFEGSIGLLTILGNIDADGLKGPVAEAVPRPHYRNGTGELMHAVCAPALVRAADIMSPIPLELDGKEAQSRIIFGLFGGDSTSYLYWHAIGRLPPYTAAITALGTDNGGVVYAGTGDGKIFALSVGSGPPLELNVETPAGSPKGGISRIVVYKGIACAVMYSGAAAYVLRLDSFTWRILRGPLKLPFEPIRGLDINRMGANVTLAAATEASVYVSSDFGDNWQRHTAGLPRNPHCSDLRFGSVNGRQFLFLSTFGRSVWMADLDANVPRDH